MRRCDDAINRAEAQTALMMSKDAYLYIGHPTIRISDAVQAIRELPSVNAIQHTSNASKDVEQRTNTLGDAVSREDALNCLNGAWGDYSVLNEVYERISKLPPVTQKPDNKYRKEAKRWKNKWLKAQKSGKWIIDRSVLPYTYTCNICDRNVFEDYDYCPFCGCAMRGDAK